MMRQVFFYGICFDALYEDVLLRGFAYIFCLPQPLRLFLQSCCSLFRSTDDHGNNDNK